MEISRDGAHWGDMQVKQEGSQVQFHAHGMLPNYGEILRVWGMKGDAQPLLIGVAEPAGEGLQVQRTLSTQYLQALGYWPELPEWYAAGISPPACQSRSDFHDPCIQALLHNDAVTLHREAEKAVFSCTFAHDCEFPLAFIFCCCTVNGGQAQLAWDEKRDCPVWTVPE